MAKQNPYVGYSMSELENEKSYKIQMRESIERDIDRIKQETAEKLSCKKMELRTCMKELANIEDAIVNFSKTAIRLKMIAKLDVRGESRIKDPNWHPPYYDASNYKTIRRYELEFLYVNIDDINKSRTVIETRKFYIDDFKEINQYLIMLHQTKGLCEVYYTKHSKGRLAIQSLNKNGIATILVDGASHLFW